MLAVSVLYIDAHVLNCQLTKGQRVTGVGSKVLKRTQLKPTQIKLFTEGHRTEQKNQDQDQKTPIPKLLYRVSFKPSRLQYHHSKPAQINETKQKTLLCFQICVSLKKELSVPGAFPSGCSVLWNLKHSSNGVLGSNCQTTLNSEQGQITLHV